MVHRMMTLLHHAGAFL